MCSFRSLLLCSLPFVLEFSFSRFCWFFGEVWLQYFVFRNLLFMPFLLLLTLLLHNLIRLTLYSRVSEGTIYNSNILSTLNVIRDIKRLILSMMNHLILRILVVIRLDILIVLKYFLVLYIIKSVIRCFWTFFNDFWLWWQLKNSF